ncbi:MAG: (Fe-S)-binding protein [Deltaproteobacteria bacterium]|nr:(Fe-S)-binding protein [Deltaproteobacteria bacterium]
MNIALNLFFLSLTIAVFTCFIFNIRKTWRKIRNTGQKAEIWKKGEFRQRLQLMLRESFGQKRMLSNPVPGIMHIIIFSGFMVICLGTLETIFYGIFRPLSFDDFLGDGALSSLFYRSQDLANFMVFLAISFAILRRCFFPPERFRSLNPAARKDAFIVLGMIWLLVTTALLTMGSKSLAATAHNKVIATPLARWLISPLEAFPGNPAGPGSELFTELFWWIHVGALFAFTSFLPFSKHQHLIWVWPNIFYKSRKNSAYLSPMNFDEDAESFGAGKAEDFTWKQLLDSMACVECGRCSSVCPASVSGKALDPRNMIHHLRDAMNEAYDQPDPTQRRDLINGIVSQEEIWACTTCGACMDACPLHIAHIPAIVDMRRYLTMTQGEMPQELQGTLEKLEASNNPWGFSNESRADWAQGLGVTSMSEKSDVEYLFWVGCAGSFDERYKQVSRSIVRILQEAGISFSILGREESCNGDTARRAGNEYLADMQIQANIETFKRYKVRKVVTGCPHCFNTIKNEYEDFGYKTEVIHHSELIGQLLREGRIQARPEQQQATAATYHDSCYLGRHNQIFDEPRHLLKESGLSLREMPANREKGFCCGAGGARMWMEENEGSRINVRRAREALETGAETIATACPFCLTMLADGVKSCNKGDDVRIMDIAEVVAESLPERVP